MSLLLAHAYRTCLITNSVYFALTFNYGMSTTVPTVTTAEALAAEVENSQRRGGGPDRGRGEEQDRGRGRGRRRGRPPIYDSPRNQISLDPNATGETTAPPAVVKKKTPRPPLTHFLSIPIGHHADLRQRISAFTTALLASDPAIPGLDETIIISPRRLHLTLGVMSLDLEGPGPDPGPDPAPSAEGSSNNSNLRPKTLESATQLLNELKPKVTELLVGQKLRVGLKRINIMKPEHGDPDRAHVLWAGPDYNDEDARRLNAISTFVHKEFRKAGLVVDDKRPLKLHSTLVNTIYRKPRGRKPFSYAAVISSTAFQAIETQPPEPANAVTTSESTNSEVREHPRGRSPLHVDLGDWDADEIQICEMGSSGPEGEYVCVGRVSLT